MRGFDQRNTGTDEAVFVSLSWMLALRHGGQLALLEGKVRDTRERQRWPANARRIAAALWYRSLFDDLLILRALAPVLIKSSIPCGAVRKQPTTRAISKSLPV